MGVETSLDLVEKVRKNALKEQTTSATRLPGGTVRLTSMFWTVRASVS